jgi:hypothetical protein
MIDLPQDWKPWAVVAVLIAAGVWYLDRKAAAIGQGIAEAAPAVAAAVNPVNPDNLANKAVSAVGAAVSGQEDWTLGGWFYDLTHNDENQANAIGAIADKILLP